MTATQVELQGLRPVADRFRSALDGLRGRVRRSLMFEGVSFVALAFAGYFVVTWPIDRLFRLEQPVRAVLLAAWGIWVVSVLVKRVFRPLAFSLDDDELALAVERTNKTLGQHLISSVQFWRRLERNEDLGQDSPQLITRVISDLPALLDGVRVGDAMRAERLRRNAWCLVAALVFVGSVAAFYPNFGLWARRNLLIGSIDWPRATHLVVRGAEDGTLTVPRGDDLTVEVDANGVVPESVRIDYRLRDTSGRETMVQNVGENRFTFQFLGLMDSVEFYAWGGDGETPWVRVKLVERPTVVAQTVKLVYPEYMKREPQELPPEASDITIPRGARVDVTATATKPLEKAWLAVGEAQEVEATVGADALSITGSIEPKASGLFAVKMLDRDKLGEGPGPRLMLRVVPDKLPRLVAKLRGLGAWITFKARIPVELSVTDDFGIQDIKMLWAAGTQAEIGTAETADKVYREAKGEGLDQFEAGSLVFERMVFHDLLPLIKNIDKPEDEANPVRPGMFVGVRFQARDNNETGAGESAGGQGQAAASDVLTFKVVTESELLRELTRRQGELRLEWEKLLAKERASRNEFAELEDPKTPGAVGATIRNRLSTLARVQKTMKGHVLKVGIDYGQILDEMINNRVGDAVGGGEATVRRRRTMIVDPIEDLGTGLIPSVARLVSEYASSGQQDMRGLALEGYDDVLKRMERILDEMKKLESFTEILTKLKDLIRQQGSAAAETKARYEKELEELFK